MENSSVPMTMYYKGYEKALIWKSCDAKSRLKIEALPEVYFSTILSVSENVESTRKGGSIGEDALYSGPFYIDIDADNIADAIKSLNKVLKKLESFGVFKTSMNIYASGSKGFHITIPFTSFTDGTPLTKLPWTYKQLARDIGLFEIAHVDKTVYSAGRGRMWRVENKKRKDNGYYKVQLTPSQVSEITDIKYYSLIKEPKTLKQAPFPFLDKFALIFKNSRHKALTTEKPKPVFVDQTLLKLLEGGLPPCAKQLMAGKNVLNGAGFNDVSLQFGKAAAAFSGYNGELHIREFSNNIKGNSYSTPEKRLAHCRNAYNTSRASFSYEFSCNSMLAVLADEPCMDCPIAFIRYPKEESPAEKLEYEEPAVESPYRPFAVSDPDMLGQSREPQQISQAVSSEYGWDEGMLGAAVKMPDNIMGLESVKDISIQNDIGFYGKRKQKEKNGPLPENLESLIETPEGYCFMEGTKLKRVSNFVMRLQKTYYQKVENKNSDIRVAVEGHIYRPGPTEKDNKLMGTFMLDDANWTKANLVGALSGLGNAAFFGTDDHVQKLKGVIMQNAEAVTDSVLKVHSVGIHRQEVNGNFVFTYVEPGWSIDQFGNQNLYSFSGRAVAFPELKNQPLLYSGCKKTSEALSLMFEINEPHRVAQVVGWTMACFLKEHIFAFKPEFPLFSLHGEPGSGKTSTSLIMGALHGVNYATKFSPLNLPGATEYVAWAFVAESTTVPRLFEEFNESRMKKPGMYGLFTEMFKQIYNGHAQSRGHINRVKNYGESQTGASVMSIPLTGPSAICSEQSIDNVALVERLLQCRFSATARFGASQKDAWKSLTPKLQDLKSFAKTAYGEALATSVDDIKARLESMHKLVPKQIDKPRPRHCFEVMFLGLDFMERIIDKYELSCKGEFHRMRKGLITWINENENAITRGKDVSEVDLIIERLNSIGASPTGEERWKVSKVYVLRDNTLYLDALAAHDLYVNFTSTTGRSQPVINRYKEFVALLEGEPYYKKEQRIVMGLGAGRKAHLLDVQAMRAKGLDVSGFLPEL